MIYLIRDLYQGLIGVQRKDYWKIGYQKASILAQHDYRTHELMNYFVYNVNMTFAARYVKINNVPLMT